MTRKSNLFFRIVPISLGWMEAAKRLKNPFYFRENNAFDNGL
jgi:hypothetical protein